MSEKETIRCNWCGRARKPSAYAGDFEFPGMVDICQYCRGVETRRTRGKALEWAKKWVAKELDLQRQSDEIEAILKKHLRDGEEEAECGNEHNRNHSRTSTDMGVRRAQSDKMGAWRSR